MGGKGGKNRRGQKRPQHNRSWGGGGDDAAGPSDDRPAAGADEPAAKQAKHANDVWRETGDIPLTNDTFEAYYTKQRICPEGEWPRFLEAMRSGLPVAIRINQKRAAAQKICHRLREMRSVCGGDAERECYAPQGLTWFPHGLAWQWQSLERRTIKKDPRHAKLKEYLLRLEQQGLITRQEAVSMIPPLFLGVEAHHLVLDFCAAPGSKTSQMLEMMHWAEADGAGTPSGLILANDVEWKRANMLAHQVARIASPCAAVTNTDAAFFPDLWDPESAGRGRILFDRVLCDVPCSGDGTLRKQPYIWKSWNLRDSIGLHIRQFNILQRGLDLLKVGGRLVYSTCSLNPVEDEAVVAAALRRHGRALKLASPPDLDGLLAAEGLEEWAVPHPEVADTYYRTYDEVPHEYKVGKCRLLPSMFPPPGADGADAEIRAAVRANCRRCLPHLMDTGGFFISIFEKCEEFVPSSSSKRGASAADESHAQEPADSSGKAETGQAVAAGPQPPAKMRNIAKDYVNVRKAIDDWSEVVDFYGLDEALSHRYFQRADMPRRIFLLSESAVRLVNAEAKTTSRLVLCGVRVFDQPTSCHVDACPWQLSQEGVGHLCAMGMRRRMRASQAFFSRLLSEHEISHEEAKAAAASGELRGLELVSNAEGVPSPGSAAVVLEVDGKLVTPMVAAAVNISDGAIELLASRAEAVALLRDVEGQPGVDDILGTASVGAEDVPDSSAAGGAEDGGPKPAPGAACADVGGPPPEDLPDSSAAGGAEEPPPRPHGEAGADA